MTQWLPKRADARGVLLAGALGVAALALVRSLPSSPFVSDILIALLLGVVALNSPLRRPLGLQLPGPEREPDRYASGFRYTGKWLLRLGIILMGLKVQTSFFGGRELLLIAGVIVVAVPGAFFIAHALASVAGVRRPFAHLLGVGTMICGASAINATAPVVRARRSEQGIAIGVVFAFSVFALLTYQPIAMSLGLSPRLAGIWAGLAVNDLSSAVAVGKQMGADGAVMAAAAKSARILVLAPTLVLLALMQRGGAGAAVRKGVVSTLPKFILGYIALAIVRAVADKLFGASTVWANVLWLDDALVDLLLCTVAAAIGLHLGITQLLTSGARALAVGGGTSVWMGALSLAMITATARGAVAAAVGIGVGGFLLSLVAYRLSQSDARRTRSLLRRLDSGDWLSLEEAGATLQAAERQGRLDAELCQRVMSQLQPAIGELIPVRETPITDGEICRWTPYWVGDNGWSLGAVLRAAGSVTEVHAHPEAMIGKAIEGEIDEVRFGVGEDGLEETSVERLVHNDVTVREAGAGPHQIRVSPKQGAIDLQLRGPSSESP
jgi:uncharacterized integral membrane protein (TIGR00698 family)